MIPISTQQRRTYLIQDPYDLDAIEFIRTIGRNHGLRPICLYTDPKARFYGEQQFPILTSDAIEQSYDVSLADLPAFVAELAEGYDICGIVPYREDTVEVAAELCELLDLDWNPPEVLRRFRDKHSMKSFVREVAPHVRTPDCWLVTSGDELRAASLPSRFVVKPNDGMANMSIGIFGADEIDRAVDHMEHNASDRWIVEEFIGGVEYHVDGQVRLDGTVEALAVYEYLRAEVNGYPTVYLGEIQLPTDDSLFDTLASYAVELLAALGLRGCPFHLEAKVDDLGPCVVDLGARLPSEGGGTSLSRMHPERPDAYAVAAHDYLCETWLGDLPLEWEAYDAARTVLVYGVSETEGFIESLTGIDEVEAMAEFVRWPVKPSIGAPLEMTNDLRGAPYIVELVVPGTRDDACRLIDEVRSMIAWNDGVGRLSAIRARATDVWHRGWRKLRWSAHTGRRRAEDAARSLGTSPFG